MTNNKIEFNDETVKEFNDEPVKEFIYDWMNYESIYDTGLETIMA